MRRRTPLLIGLLVALALIVALTLTLRSCEGNPLRSTTPSARTASAPGDARPTELPTDPAPAGERPRRRRVAPPGAPPAAPPDASDPPVESVVPAQTFTLIVRRADTGAGVRGLLVTPVKDRRRSRRTDSTGRVEFEPLTGELTLEVATQAPGAETLTLPLADSVVEVAGPVPLEIRWVDAETGGAIDGSVAAALSSARPEVIEDVTTQSVTLLNAPIWPGARYDLHVDVVVADDDWVSPPPAARRRTGQLSRYAQRAAILLPIPRAASIRAVVFDADGGRVSGARVRASTAGVTIDGETGANGVAVVSGLPYFRGGSVVVHASLPGRSAPAETVVLRELGVAPTVTLELPAANARWTSSIGIGGGAGGAFGGRRGLRRTLQPGTAALVIQVLRRDGSPATDAHVGASGPWRGGGTTDAAGRVRLERLPAGDYRIACSEHGLAAMVENVTLADGETLHVTLQEPAGSWLRVRVVDTSGAPLPHASLELRSPGDQPWVRLERGVQYLDLHTDSRGEARVRVPDDTVRVVARYGSREADVRRVAGHPWVDGRATVTIPD